VGQISDHLVRRREHGTHTQLAMEMSEKPETDVTDVREHSGDQETEQRRLEGEVEEEGRPVEGRNQGKLQLEELAPPLEGRGTEEGRETEGRRTEEESQQLLETPHDHQGEGREKENQRPSLEDRMEGEVGVEVEEEAVTVLEVEDPVQGSCSKPV